MEIISSPIPEIILIPFEVYSHQESVLSEIKNSAAERCEMMELRKHLVDTYYLPMKGKNWYDKTIEDEDRFADQDEALPENPPEEETFQVVAPKKKRKKKKVFKTSLEISYITCTSCNKKFQFTAHQANEYKKKGWAPRKKCRNCKSK